MILYHATHVDNLEGILREGLLQAMAQGKYPLVWLAQEGQQDWAVHHVCERHGWNRQDIVVLTVDTDGGFLRKHSSGKLMCFRDVAAEDITDVSYVKHLVQSF